MGPLADRFIGLADVHNPTGNLNVCSVDITDGGLGSHFLCSRRERHSVVSDVAALASGVAAPLRQVSRRTAVASFLDLSVAKLETRSSSSSSSSSSRRATVFEAFQSPLLGDVRIRLLYQTPEVYLTDVGQQKKVKLQGWKYACDSPDEDGMGEEALPPDLHPRITFNQIVKRIHVRMEDTKTGQVYWDADYDIPTQPLENLAGKSVLKPNALPANPANPGTKFRKPCLPKDDNEPHLFDISIQTQDKTYNDGFTPWGNLEGFHNFRGSKAHIGFEAYRLPVLEQDPESGMEKEKLGDWEAGGSYSRGPAHASAIDRVLYGDEDPWYNSKTGDTGKMYYDYIINPWARRRGMYQYLDKYAPPPLNHPQHQFEGDVNPYFGPEFFLL